MRSVLGALVVSLVAAAAGAQETASYTPSESPFQGEYPLTLAAPIDLHVDIQGVRVATIALTPAAPVEAGKEIRCEAAVTGENAATARATLRAVLLLEDEAGRSLQKIGLQDFRPKGGRPFDERQDVRVAGDALLAATKVYVFLEVSF